MRKSEFTARIFKVFRLIARKLLTFKFNDVELHFERI